MLSSSRPSFEGSTATRANSSEIPKANSCRLATKNVWRVIKCIIFMTCVTFFTYQTTEIYNHYYTYPMRTNIDVVKSRYFKIPAITICLRNLVNRTYYCGQYPHLCSRPNNLEEFCKKHPYMCKEGNASNLVDFEFFLSSFSNLECIEIPMVGYYTNSSKETTAEIKKTLQELVRTTKETEFSDSPEWEEIYTMDDRGIIPYPKCYSRFLHIFSKDNQTTEYILPSNPTFLIIEIPQKKEEYLFPWYASQVFLLVHSPFEPARPTDVGNKLMSGFEYEINVRLEEENRLPAPYATDCTDYETLWLQNNKTGPRSYQMCRELCVWEFSIKLSGCVYPFEMIVKWDTICLEVNYSLFDDPSPLLLCFQSCKSDCQRLKYIYTVTESPIEPNPRRNFKIVSDIISLSFYARDRDVNIISHVPLYGGWELFSYIGGLIGCWLGISVWALVGIGEKTLRKCAQFLMKLKKRTKQATAVSTDSKEH